MNCSSPVVVTSQAFERYGRRILRDSIGPSHWMSGELTAINVDGITTVYYDFPDSWLGDDPNFGLTSAPDRLQRYFNLITEQQKQRIREVVSLYSEYLGVQFVETNGVPAEAAMANATYVAIAVGELYGAGYNTFENSEVGGVTVATRPLDASGNTFLPSDPNAPIALTSGNNLLVMDFQDFDGSTDDQLGGEFFRGGLLGVGQLLGYGYADHLPQPVTQATSSVLNPGLDNEPAFPSPSDIVNGQYLYRPESNDVDLYRFTLDRSGTDQHSNHRGAVAIGEFARHGVASVPERRGTMAGDCRE